MTLREKQSKLVKMTAVLILYAEGLGYELTYGEAWRHPEATHGHPTSLHKIRLAVDFNLFKDGVWLTQTEDHQELGEFWESMGGTWGGQWGDGNHYSIEHEGMK